MQVQEETRLRADGQSRDGIARYKDQWFICGGLRRTDVSSYNDRVLQLVTDRFFSVRLRVEASMGDSANLADEAGYYGRI